MDKRLETSLLFDFYGELLTEKQKEVYRSHYEDDLSFSEIGNLLNMTRQSAYDSLKHTQKILEEYEEKLGLVRMFLDKRKELEQILILLDDKNKIDEVKDRINRMIEE